MHQQGQVYTLAGGRAYLTVTHKMNKFLFIFICCQRNIKTVISFFCHIEDVLQSHAESFFRNELHTRQQYFSRDFGLYHTNTTRCDYCQVYYEINYSMLFFRKRVADVERQNFLTYFFCTSLLSDRTTGESVGFNLQCAYLSSANKPARSVLR